MLNNPEGLLEVNALSAEIGGRSILSGVSLRIAPADWLAIVGGSGAGKSTLLRLIMGLRRPARATGGDIIFNGETWSSADRIRKKPKQIAFVPQSPAHGYDPLRRLRWQLVQLASTIGKGSSDHTELLRSLGLPDLNRSYPHEWSRGMQQRLLLAMALLSDPKLLILDEPTSALDPLIAAQVLQMVQRIATERDIAVIMVTHDLALAARYATHIAVMDKGHVVEAGPCQALLSSPTTDYGRELVTHRYWHTAQSNSFVAAR